MYISPILGDFTHVCVCVCQIDCSTNENQR